MTWAIEVGQAIATRIANKVPALKDELLPLDTLRRTTTSTTYRALMLVADIGDSDTTLASAEVSQIAGEFVRRGLELNDLLRAIRVGYAVLAAALLDAVNRLLPPEESSAELRRISVLLFEELDDFTDVAASAFLDEKGAWAAGVSAARFELITRIVAADAAEDIDTADAKRILDYPLDGHHVALIAWSTPHSRHDLRAVVDPVLRQWAAPTSSLVVPVGQQSIWAWGAFPSATTFNDPNRLPFFDDTFIAAGGVGSGIEGFRRSHLEARAVERLIRRRPDLRPATVAHEHVALEVLLLNDPDAASQFVSRRLGPLAGDDPRMAELRSTLSRYFDLNHSLAKVAAAEHISKNTVTYRIQQALTLCGHAGDSTTDLRAALRIHKWLHGTPHEQ
ncbi:hypothetical protein KEK_23126 [Mycolicibacterium thermoresistibile ATCC 19527]|uniref:PucR family transcriptional regulator n=1 Tax=Mycolicibacterium thermoresistibile (strain ATCC 19527 / DSM 44167 / CIP 105390 / JCM 6362 / NCTC 10409 / 316) TaxID=1078020 RepID=G7CNM7_MYCT3|nr:hypothetical protein KEK_23126 [Mycolicibacterium thermoresistibile ATCC 19527]